MKIKIWKLKQDKDFKKNSLDLKTQDFKIVIQILKWDWKL